MLFQYLDIIYKVYSCFTRTEWLQYDEEFCMLVVASLTLSWDQVHQQLWFQIMSTAWPNQVTGCTMGISYNGQLEVQVPMLARVSWFNPGCYVRDLIPRTTVPEEPVCTSMNAPVVGGTMLFQHVPSPDQGSSRRGSEVGIHPFLLQVKGPNPIRLMALNEWLNRFPKLEEVEYLHQGFSWSFCIFFLWS